MTDLPTLEAAMKLADQDSPLPSLAGPALKVLRQHIDHLSLQLLPMAIQLLDKADTKDSATLKALIAELRVREVVGRAKYGTDVDRTDLTNAQWRQHLREELMDALLYSLAEERTAPANFTTGRVKGVWRNIEIAPTDGTPVLVKVKPAASLPDRAAVWGGHVFVARNKSDASEWCFAAPVGCGGFLDAWLEGWMPLPAPEDC